MSRRSVIKHGPSTHIISLPASWVHTNNVNKGDELQVIENGNELIVTTDVDSPVQSIDQDVSQLTPFLVTRLLASNYQKGYDSIRLTHKNQDILAAIQEQTQQLMGFEIIEQNETSCTINSVTQNLDIDFDNSLSKAFLIVKQMLNSCQQAYDVADTSALQNIKQRDFEVNRFTYFCLRQINKQRNLGIQERHQTFVLFYLVETLESLADTIVLLARQLSESSYSALLANIVAQLSKQYMVSIEYFSKPSASHAKKGHQLYSLVHELIQQAPEDKLSKHSQLAIHQAQYASELMYPFITMRLDLIELRPSML